MRFISRQTMSQFSTNFLLVPIPEYPVVDCAPNKIIKLVVLGGNSVGKTGKSARGEEGSCRRSLPGGWRAELSVNVG